MRAIILKTQGGTRPLAGLEIEKNNTQGKIIIQS